MEYSYKGKESGVLRKRSEAWIRSVGNCIKGYQRGRDRQDGTRVEIWCRMVSWEWKS